MDPNKPASAPPMGWTDEKSVTGQPPLPPPYQGSPYPGPPQSDLAYPPQPQGFGALPQYGAGYVQQPYAVGQQYPGQPGVITIQPAVAVAPLSPPVSDYLGYSIFTMLCCCLPLGIAALIHSVSVREANHRGDRASAERYSTTARTLNHVALALGLLALIASIVVVVISLTVY